MVLSEFDRLVADGESASVEGWGFDWFDGRATESRPPWRYSTLMAEQMARAASALDVQTGGGEVLAEVAHPPALLVATEGWPPNVGLAQRNLRVVKAHVVRAPDAGPLPFRDDSFDLVVARHPTVTPWREIHRVLRPGGEFLSQQVGAGSLHELTEALMGPRPIGQGRSPSRARAAAEAAGLTVVDLREATLETVFFDIAAVIAFLRKVIWIVPGFEVGPYRDQLRHLHGNIRTDGRFVAHAKRFLIKARKPSTGPASQPTSAAR